MTKYAPVTSHAGTTDTSMPTNGPNWSDVFPCAIANSSPLVAKHKASTGNKSYTIASNRQPRCAGCALRDTVSGMLADDSGGCCMLDRIPAQPCNG